MTKKVSLQLFTFLVPFVIIVVLAWMIVSKGFLVGTSSYIWLAFLILLFNNVMNMFPEVFEKSIIKYRLGGTITAQRIIGFGGSIIVAVIWFLTYAS